MTKPIRVWVCPPGPNSWKVIMILEELQLPYEIIPIRFENIKTKPILDLNPNGRVPVIEDPNTGLTLWETGAIILYLVKQYDTKNKLTYDDLAESNQVNQWLMFQISGQGPYWGQATWFQVLHAEKLPSAIKRYVDEIKRVLGVLEGCLTDRDWLVGDKMTFADLAFIPWNNWLEMIILCEEEKKFDGFPMVKAWHERMTSLPSWKKCMEHREELMDAQGLMSNGMPKGVADMEEYKAMIRRDNQPAGQ